MSILLFCAPKPNARPSVLLLGDVARGAAQSCSADAFPFGLGGDFRLRPPPVRKRSGQRPAEEREGGSEKLNEAVSLLWGRFQSKLYEKIRRVRSGGRPDNGDGG